jgi:4-hydroxymandelate oxidase
MSAKHPAADLQPTLRDYESRARALLSADRSAYFFGGAADEQTLAANEKAFSELELLPRVLRDLRGGIDKTDPARRIVASPDPRGSGRLPETGSSRR